MSFRLRARLAARTAAIVAAVFAATAASAVEQKKPAAPAPSAPATTAPAASAPAPSVPAAQPAPAEAPAPAQPKPVRTEIRPFDNWTVTCREYADPAKKVCTATLQLNKTGTNQFLFAWTIAVGDDGGLEGGFLTLTGVAIPKGVDLRIGTAAPRKFGFATCEPDHCTVHFEMDAALRKELVGATKAEVIVYGSTGNALKLDLPLAGIDKALVALKP